MNWCPDCQKFLPARICPTCGGPAFRRQSLFKVEDDDISKRRRISTIREEDPHDDDINRIHDDVTTD